MRKLIFLAVVRCAARSGYTSGHKLRNTSSRAGAGRLRAYGQRGVGGVSSRARGKALPLLYTGMTQARADFRIGWGT